ncbi:hypothetical protein C9374_014337 [Naegleria lovaniensis]|uniref:Uncharacterized protein n=1 Tax=Naegleria lovaniensis TaxID=51637 RepID=A0AA88GXM0_NAELO|nr:uncharacterized protein C9374_014337 [Naegleria lovaniensis]KAG2388937.1 hypothetical protein C9374_014337 [Naegleria lovaniensis]
MNNHLSIFPASRFAETTEPDVKFSGVIDNIEDLKRIAKLGLAKTRAYRISRQVADFNFEENIKVSKNMVPMTDEDIQEIRTLVNLEES